MKTIIMNLKRFLLAGVTLLCCGAQSGWAATMNVSPGNNIAVYAAAAAAGDTIKFAPGNYTIRGTAANPTVLPPDRHYVGNGAILSGSGANLIVINGGTATEVTGFTFSGVSFGSTDSSDGLNIHDNTFAKQTGDAIFLSQNSNGHVDHNTFNNVGGNGIYAYPGTHNTYNYNRMDGVGEGMHLSTTTGDGTDVSYNVITNSKRHGIEIQEFINGLTVTHNYCQAADMQFSIACGAKGTPPFADGGQNITVSNNVGDGRPVAQYGAIIEIMGDSNIHCDHNFMIGNNGKPSGWGFLNGTGGQRGQGLNTSGNIIAVPIPYGDGDSTPWPLPKRVSNDTIYTPGDAKTPAIPAMPTFCGANVTSGTVTNGADGTVAAPLTGAPATGPTTGPTIGPTTGPTSDASSTGNATPVGLAPSPVTDLTAVAATDGIHLSWSAVAGATSYTVKWATPAGDTKSQTTSGTSLIDQTLPNSWVATYSISATVGGIATAPATVQVQAALAQIFAPASVTTTTPTTQPVYFGHSRDGKVWVVDATVQP